MGTIRRHFPNLPIIASLISIALLTAGCGSEDKAAAAQPRSEPVPVVAEDGAQRELHLATFVPGQPQLIDLEHQQKETVFEDRDVPSTCTRQVQRGTRQDCSTEYRNECRTEYERECRNVAYPVCTNQPENVCRNVSDRVCRDESVLVCQNVPRRVCETVRGACRQETTRVCDSRGCRDVPRTTCDPPREVCRTVDDRVCHNETRQRCENVSRRECRLEDRRVCRDDYRQECSNVQRERCSQVPYQACRTVPVIVDEQYACTERQRVPVGERVVLRQLAHVKVELRNPRNLNVSVDTALLTLEDGEVLLEIQGQPSVEYRVKRTHQSMQRLSDTEQVIQATFLIEVL